MRHSILAWITGEAVLLAALLAGAAVAETSAPAAPRPCQEELEKFCSGAVPGAGSIVFCLQQHSSELTELCRGHVEKALTRREEAKQGCMDDIRKFCAEVAPGERRLLKCLSSHVDELTPRCRQQAIWSRKPVEKANAKP